ncbi:Fc receptor-like protein 3 isoform X1 [Xenopus laevis]|uniref:Fc receptor-like protein 3 isoform X1 n=3 Tax=Xenopus laevis TaxID=8355 RepID=A0A8J1LK09_XENLA|nr:Fc receptor-like protein 3 isoform X1 [Xenopus laevis]
MSLLLTLLFLTVMATENAGAAVRPIVNFSSNWATIFTSESVTMTCNVDSTAQGDLGYSWYKDGSLIGSGQQKYTIVTAKESHRGEYKCKTHDSDLSEAAKLTVSHGYLALKVPPFVFEGDILELSCAAYPGYSAGDAELHKGDQSIGSSHSGNFNIGRVNMKTSGSYTCSRSVKHHLIYYGQKSSVYISVKELFSKPIISGNSGQIQINEGGHMTITCDTKLSPHRATTELQFAFYRNGHNVQGFSLSNQYGVPSAQLEDSANYTCEIKAQSGGVKKESDPKSIQIKGWLTLKVPAFVFEGDELYVSCAGYPGYSARDVVLYKDNEVIGSSPSNADFLVGRANMTTSGLYRCTRQVKNGLIYYNYSSEKHISVKELFPKPVIQVNLNHLTEGDHMTITCDTKLSPHRETTELQFVFYRNGHNVQGFSLSNQYGVPSAQLEDSGNYTCEVQTPTGSVRKRSNVTHIHIQELFPYPLIKAISDQVTEGDHMTITCDTKLSPHRATTELQFVFYRNGHNVQGFSLSKQYGVPSAQMEDSGKYTCEVQTPTGSVRKRSDNINIQVTELFSPPQIKVTQDQVTEGDHMTITCDTNLRNTTELQFAFYINGIVVQHFSSSHEYRVPSAAPKDSGNYTCEVQSTTGSVRKRSSGLNISNINKSSNNNLDNTTLMLIIVVTVALAVLISLFIIAFLILKSKKNQHRRQSSQRKTLSGPGETNLDEDVCYMSINFNRQPKAHSTSQNNDDGDNVIYAAVKGSDRRNTQAAYKQVQRENSVVYAALKTPGGNKNNQELRTIPQDENCVYASVKKR